ncbi:MAG: hypothetical protein LRZ99_01755 [Desulfotomaculum sp.]|nr:hypothetical protein [Desulfotomaculum sp.]
MNKFGIKALSLFTGLLLALLVPVMSVQAAEIINEEAGQAGIKVITNQILKNQQNIQENTEQVQIQWRVKIARESLKKLSKALDNPSNIQTIKSGMKGVGLGKYTRKVDGAVNNMKKAIDELLEWEEVTTQNLRDKLSGALYDAGLPLGAARGIAKLVVDLLL